MGVFIPHHHFYILSVSDISEKALIDLASKTRTLENSYLGSLILVQGDFDQTALTVELPTYRQQVKHKIRGKNMIDHCYSVIDNTYHAIARPPIAKSDHNMMHLLPSYRQKLETSKPKEKNPRIQNNKTSQSQKLQDCLALTHWGVFRSVNKDLHG